jgi:hypothetical protein
MSVLDKVYKAKQESEERLTRGGGARAQFWKPRNGENRIRIMPPWTNEVVEFLDQFWRQVAQHWNVSEDQRGPVLCPKRTPGLNDDCPICEFVDSIKKDKSNVQAQALVKDIRAKITFLYNIVDMKDAVYTAEDVAEWTKSRPGEDCPFQPGATKIQVYAAPLTVHDAILGVITANKKDITRLEDGRCVLLTRFPSKDPKKTRYQVMPEFESSGFEVDPKEFNPLHQMGFTMNYEEMLDLLQTGAASDFIGSLPEGKAAAELPAENEMPVEEETQKAAADLAEQLRQASQ